MIPEEVEILVLAQELGALTLSLRNEDDIDIGTERNHYTSIRTLFDGERIASVQRLRQQRITFIRNSTVTEETVR